MIKTDTSTFGRNGAPNRGIIIGRIGDINDLSAPRFLANVPDDKDLLTAMTQAAFIGSHRTVVRSGDVNQFRPS